MDSIDPAFGIPLAIILWTVLLMTILIGLRRAKVRADKYRRMALRTKRRETYIQIAEYKEREYVEGLQL